MKSAAVVNFSSEPHSVEVREVERPSCGDDDVIVQVEAASVCGSDLHQWEGSNSWPVNYPVVLGHEFAGHVVELIKSSGSGWPAVYRNLEISSADNSFAAASRSAP